MAPGGAPRHAYAEYRESMPPAMLFVHRIATRTAVAMAPDSSFIATRIAVAMAPGGAPRHAYAEYRESMPPAMLFVHRIATRTAVAMAPDSSFIATRTAVAMAPDSSFIATRTAVAMAPGAAPRHAYAEYRESLPPAARARGCGGGGGAVQFLGVQSHLRRTPCARFS